MCKYFVLGFSHADVDQLPDEEDIITRNGLTVFHDDETLGYGRWKYFQFQVWFICYSSDRETSHLIDNHEGVCCILSF